MYIPDDALAYKFRGDEAKHHEDCFIDELVERVAIALIHVHLSARDWKKCVTRAQ